MARLYDMIMRDRHAIQNAAAAIDDEIWAAATTTLAYMDDAVVINGDNVSRYCFDSQKQISIFEIPNCIPPFRRMFLEYPLLHLPKIKRVGYFLESLQLENGLYQILSTSFCQTSDKKIGYPFGSAGRENSFVRHKYLLRADGVLIDEQMQVELYGGWHSFASYENSEYFNHPIYYPLSIMLHILAFMNTKNVEIIDNPPPPKLSKKHEKRYGRPLVTYKTIKVNPMSKRRADNDSEPSEGGIPERLHICRGHFKDFRHGAGLFGKYKDIFWWDQHLRGDVNEGVIVNDYEVLTNA